MDMNDLFGDYQNGNYSSQVKEQPLHQNDQNNKNTKIPKQKKKSGFLVVFLLLLIILGVVGGGAYVFLFTDAFKTPKQLMGKYMLTMIAASENNTPISNQIVLKEKGTATVDGTLTVMLKELSEGLMEDINADIDLAVDYDADFTDLRINTVLEEQKYDISLVTNKDIVAVGSGLVDLSEDFNGAKYVGIKNENLKDFAKKFNIEEEMLKFIPDKINFDGLKEIFSEEEMSDITKRYFEILNSHLPEEKFGLEENVKITVDGKDYITKKVILKMSSLEVYEIILDAIKELKQDEVVLNSYKKVVDIEIPKDKIDEVFDEIIIGMEDTIEIEKEAPSGTMELAMYIYEKLALQIQFIILDDEAEVLEEVTYSNIKTDAGIKVITEVYTPAGSFSPAVTERNTVDITYGPTSEKLVYTMETDYEEDTSKKEDDDMFSSFYSYEDTKSECVYEIKDFSSKGYKDSFVASSEGKNIFKFESKVKFDEKVEVIKLTDSNTVFINDMTMEKMEELVTGISTQLTALMPEDDYGYTYEDDYTFEDDWDTTNTIGNTIDNTILNTVTNEVSNEIDYSRYEELYNTPTVDDTEEEDTTNFDVLSSELESAVNTCKTEAENSDYVVRDYLNTDNLKLLCPSITEIILVEEDDVYITFNIKSGIEEYEYKLQPVDDNVEMSSLSKVR